MLHIDGSHSMQEYLQLLNTSSKLYIDEERFQRSLKECGYRVRDLEYLCLAELRKECGGMYSQLTKDNIIDYLEELGVDFTKRFVTKKGGDPSLDIKKVVTPLIEQGIAVEVLTLYKQWRTQLSYLNFMSKMDGRYNGFHQNANGRIILEYDTNISEQENLRVYYHDIAVVSIPKVFSNMITGPSYDYHLAWCDYPQADWRFAYNLFIRDETNEDLFASCNDAYEGLARMVEGDKFNPEVFAADRNTYKVNCLSTFYNSSDNRPIPKAMRQYFQSRPRYSKYMFDLSALYRFKLPVPINSYFGFEQLLPEAPYESAFVSKGLNTPIQTFTSHVVNETVIGILNRFWELGYTKDDINIYYVRHDEPIFMFKDTIMKDAWIFKDCSEIHIDGFTPIKLDFHFGNYYREEDEQLTEHLSTYMNAYDDRLHIYPVGEKNEYNPTPSVESLYMMVFGRENDAPGHQYRFYNHRNGEVYVYDSECADTQEGAAEVINKYLVEKVGNPRYLLVMCNDYEWMDAVGPTEETLLKVIRKQDSTAAVILIGEKC